VLVRTQSTEWLPTSSPGAVAVVSALVTDGPMSRSDLSRRTGLTSAGVTKVVAPLADTGYVREVGPTLNGGLGRPASRIEICGDAAYFVGLKITGDEILGVLVDLSGHTRATAHTTLDDRGVEPVVDAVVDLCEQLCATPAHRERMRHVGIGISGGVDESGLVSYSHFLGWHGVRLAPLVHARLGLPIVVENDVRALTEGERWFGAGAGRSSFAVVTIGAGIGCALSYQGRVLAGAHGVSGELGHLPVAGDRRCHCGAVGCLDTVATTASILRDVSDAVREPVEDLDAAVEWGRRDARAETVFREAGHAVGRGLASIVNLFGPECVVLTGEGMAALDLIREPMRAGFVEHAYGQAIHSELIMRPLSFEAWAHGAATIALQAFIRGEGAL
jgi:predicted NBD/HSP70 family sugar kinase